MLITGTAGFIGFHLARRMLMEGYNVVGLDNINGYYDVNLKYARLAETGIQRDDIEYGKYTTSIIFNGEYTLETIPEELRTDSFNEDLEKVKSGKFPPGPDQQGGQPGKVKSAESRSADVHTLEENKTDSNLSPLTFNLTPDAQSSSSSASSDPDPNLSPLTFNFELPTYNFIKMDLADKDGMAQVFSDNHFDIVIHLAAQAGVRYSLENPHAYIESNVTGFLNVLEGCRHNDINWLYYASSSSVYGANTKLPFSEEDRCDKPISLYAATKKNNEEMAYTYSHLFGINTIGLRFFTVYGPWGRPDMAYWKFTEKILNCEEIEVFNNGELSRDMTFIDDGVTSINELIETEPKDHANTVSEIYNIGGGNKVALTKFINVIEDNLARQSKKKYLPMQSGDVYSTISDIRKLEKQTNTADYNTFSDGYKQFLLWYQQYQSI